MARSSSANSKWDFSKEEDFGGKRYKEGDYLVRVMRKAKAGTSEEKGTPYLELWFKFKDGKYKGETFSQRFYNSPKALWLMRSLIEACGGSLPKRASDPKKVAAIVVDNDVIVTLSDNTNPNDGRTRSQVSDVLNTDDFEPDSDDEDDDEDFDIEDEDEEEEEEEEEAPRSRRRSKSRSRKPKRDEEDEEEDEDDVDLEEIDLDSV